MVITLLKRPIKHSPTHDIIDVILNSLTQHFDNNYSCHQTIQKEYSIYNRTTYILTILTNEHNLVLNRLVFYSEIFNVPLSNPLQEELVFSYNDPELINKITQTIINHSGLSTNNNRLHQKRNQRRTYTNQENQ